MPEKVTGGMGAVPPPGAPHEVTQPLDPAVLASQLAQARENEKELAPLTFSARGGVAPAPIVKAPRGVVASVKALAEDFFGPDKPKDAVVLTDAPEIAPAKSHQPAASNTDSPSRGVPTPIADKGKQITGGFGDIGEAQYFPLDGIELRGLILTLMDELAARIQDDLRFSIATCYPRVTARVEIHVEGYAEDQGFVIPKVMPPHERTPVEIAKQHGDQVVFVVVSERREMTPDGESVSPPNKLRAEIGVSIPRKQSVDVPGGRMLVDVTQ